jgi:hypothetical protein
METLPIAPDETSPCQACGAGFDSGKIRQRQAIGNALRRRPMFGIGGEDRGGDVVHDLCGAPGSLPDLHARRCRMRDGAAAAWITRADFSIVVPAK